MGSAMTWEPIAGNFPGNGLRKAPLRERIAAALARLPTKEVARVAEAAPRTVEAWKHAENAPGAEALIRLCARFDEVWQVVREGACRDQTDAERMLDQMAAMLKGRRQ